MNYLINVKKTDFFKTMGKRLCFSLLIMVGSLMQSCQTDIPASDITPPTFSFRITGDGFNRTFTQADDFSRFQLNVKTGTAYNFVYTGSDAGGLKLMQMQVPNDYIAFETPINSPLTESVSGLSRYITWRGDAANPLTGSVISGTFRVSGNNSAYDIKFLLEDYGGRSSSVNRIFTQLNIQSGQHNTEVFNY